MNVTKEREKQQAAFVNGLLAVAMAHGVTKQMIKRDAFSSYGTGNRRIEHEHGEITLTEISNIAKLCRLSPAALMIQAAKILSKEKNNENNNQIRQTRKRQVN